MKKILFVCIHNSARSQMAEAFMNVLAAKSCIAESAGIEGGKLNPVVVSVMSEIGIDISSNKTKTVDDILRAGKSYDYVITVCDEASAERCPLFPGGGKKLHWGFPDPSSFVGEENNKLERTRIVRDAIKERVKEFVENGIPKSSSN